MRGRPEMLGNLSVSVTDATDTCLKLRRAPVLGKANYSNNTSKNTYVIFMNIYYTWNVS